MVLRILNVAEKPSAAKEIVAVLRQGAPMNMRQTQARYNNIFEFSMTVSNHPSQMVFTSVLGHLKETHFEQRVKKWASCDPATLLDPDATQVFWSVAEDKRPLASMLSTESRRADWLILWLDCDSEGEKIAYDVAEVCREAKSSLLIKRARFSAMTHTDLFRAIGALDVLNVSVAAMVATRQEIDLRAGSAYTRFLTIQLEKFALNGDDRSIISYGPCQFPTLGLVVDRWLRIDNFVAQPFWVIDIAIHGCKVPFEWMRKHIFDEHSAWTLYELCAEQAAAEGSVAVVTRVDKRSRSRWRPLPLSTVELQKVASRSLRISSHRTMEIAEGLYNKGLISYPRTETDQFARSYNLRSLIQKQTGHPNWGDFASRLMSPPNQGDPITFNWPRAGRNDDKAHPPIHPTDAAPPSFESNEHQRVYEYITKRFLACCSIDAVGAETRAELRAGSSELFSTKGLIVEQRGYLEVMHPFEQWNDKDMPIALLNVGARLGLEKLELRESKTQPPPLLQEADLIALMDHHGIGTDATIAEHIQKVQDRNYVEKLPGGRFTPTEVGKALVIAHEQIELHLARPHMRARQEEALKTIPSGQAAANEVLRTALQEYLTKFTHLRNARSALDEVFRDRFAAQSATSWRTLIPQFSLCGACGNRMALKSGDRSVGGTGGARGRGARGGARGSRGRGSRGSRGGRGGRGRGHSAAAAFAGGNGSILVEGAERAAFCGSCNSTHKLPRNGMLEPKGQNCAVCGFEAVTVRNMETQSEHTVCPKCYSDPPADTGANPEGKTSEFRCFSCTKSGCAMARGTPAGLGDVAQCALCGRPCALRTGRDAAIRFICCTAPQGECSFIYWFPRNSTREIVPDGGNCAICGSKRLRVTWNRGVAPPGVLGFLGCVWCDQAWGDALGAIGEMGSAPQPPHPGNRGRGRGGTRGRGTRGRATSSGGRGWGRGRGGSRVGDIEDVGGRGRGRGRRHQ